MADTEIVDPFEATNAAATQPSVVDPFAPGYEAPRSPFVRGVAAAAHGLKGAASGLVAAAGDAVGSDAIKQYGLGVARNAQQETPNPAEGPAPQIANVKSFGDAVDYAQYGVGFAIPNALAAAAAAIVGRAGGNLAAKGVANAAEAMWLRNAGAVAGLQASNIAQEVGSIYPEAVEHGSDNPLARSIIGGGLAGVAGSLPETYIAARLGLLGKEAAGGASKSLIANVMKDVGIAGGTGAAAGVAQRAVERAAVGKDLGSDEATSEYTEAAGLGLIGGAAGGLVSGVAGGKGHGATEGEEVRTPQEGVVPVGEEVTPVATEKVGGENEAVPAEAITKQPLSLDIPAEQMTLADNTPVSEAERNYLGALDKQKALESRLVELDAESKAPKGERRSKQAIMAERNAIFSEIGGEDAEGNQHGLHAQIKNYEALLSSPEYQQKGSLAEAKVLGSDAPALEAPKIMTPEESNIRQQAEQIAGKGATDEAITTEAARIKQGRGMLLNDTEAKLLRRTSPVELQSSQSDLKTGASSTPIEVPPPSNKRSSLKYDIAERTLEEKEFPITAASNETRRARITEPVIIGEEKSAAPSFGGEAILRQSALLKRENGELLSADEAKAVRNIPSIEAPDIQLAGGSSPRATFKQAGPAAGREFILDAGSRLAAEQAKTLRDLGVIKTDQSAKSIQSGFNKAVSDMLASGDVANAKDILENGILNTLKGKVNKLDSQTIAGDFVSKLMAEKQNFVEPNLDKALLDKGTVAYSKAAMTPAELDTTFTLMGQRAVGYLDRIIGNAKNLEVRTFIANPDEGAGSIRLAPHKDIIELATNAKDQMSVAAHEGYHYLEFRVLNPGERAVVANQFRPGTEIFARLLEKASAYDLENGTKLADEIRAVPAEARAYGFEFWRRGELAAPTVLGRAWEKVRQMVERVSNAIRGLGFQSREDIFDAIDKGRYAREDGNPFRTLNLEHEPLPSDPILLMSRSALEDLALRSRNGEIPTSQLHGKIAGMLEHTSIPEGLRERLFRNGSGELRGASNSLKRAYLENISSGLNLARRSAGYRNVFDILTTYTQRKNRVIADNVETRLSSWIKGATDEDKRVTSAALLDRTVGGHDAASPEYQAIYQKLTSKQRELFDQATKMVAHTLDQEFQAEQQSYARVLGQDSEAFKEWTANRAAQVEHLKNAGYFPERRYGDHVVHSYIETSDGKKLTLYYTQHEREADARVALPQIQQAFASDPLVKTEYAYKYKADYDGSISMQQFLDMASRNGVSLTQEEKERLAKSLISADSTRRNRIFRRQNIAGYSDSGLRILAEHGVSIANKVAYAELGGALNDAMDGKQVQTRFDQDGHVQIDTVPGSNVWAQDGEMSGFYRNLADKTADFVMSPKEGSKLSAGLRAAASIQFLGGSISAGVVQLTSIPMNTVPWLTQHTSYTDALGKAVSGFKLAIQHRKELGDIPTLLDRSVRLEGIDNIDGLRSALTQAAQDGTTLDTEIHQIMGLSRGQEYSMSSKGRDAVNAWMLPFRVTENVNRLSTFIAAYKVAKDKNLDNTAAYKLAQDTVYGTQFRYDEANRPAIARTPVGALLFTFRSYPIFMTEMVAHLAKEKPAAAVAMLASLGAVAGIEGMPFAEDIEDLIDTVAYRLFNSPFNSKRALKNMLKNASEAVVGADLSGVGMHGLANELTGMQFASRVGLGNIIPGTRIGAADADYKSVVQDVLGPTASMANGYLQGISSLTKGQYVDAMKQALPLGAQNFIKGAQQWQQGFATDIGGRKLVDVSGPEAFWQSLGFSSTALSKAYEADKIDKQTLAFYQQAKEQLSTDLTKAVVSGNTARAEEISNAILAWNKNNPQFPLVFSPNSTRKTLQQAGLPLDSRTFLKLPKVLRGNAETAVGLDTE